MAFYDNFVKSTVTPKQYWIEQLQEMVSEQFDNASTIQYDIEEEDSFGSMTFHPVECRITTLVDAKTGQRVNDDYKKIIYKDLTKNPDLGTRYRFDNNIWMVFSTDNIKTPTSSAYLRRCNNVITTEDKYGNIHQEPCYIDYKITETQLFKEYTMDVPAGRISVIVQNNKYTSDIAINKRYIFNGNVYKVREMNKFDRNYTFNKDSATTISFYADVDAINPADRFDIDVADYFVPAYKVNSDTEIENIAGYSNTISAFVTFVNDEVVDEPLYFESTDITVCRVNQYNGNFELVGVGQCEIYCRMFNNPNIYSIIKVIVAENIPDEVIDIIEPKVNYIKLNQPQTYYIYSYKNNKKLNTKFDIKAYDVPDNYFTMECTDNSFTILYTRYYEDGLLKIICTNLDNNEQTEFLIELGGVW